MISDIEKRWSCFVQLEEGQKGVKVDRESIPETLEKGHRIWIDISTPTEEDTGWLEDVFDFHTLALSDVLNNDVHPKQELYENVLFTVFGAVNLNPGEYPFDTINLNLFLTDKYLVTTHFQSIGVVHTVQKRVLNDPEFFSKGTDHVYYSLLDGIVDRYVTVIDKMEEEIENLEEDIFDNDKPDIQERLFELKRKTAYAKRSLRPKREALRVLVHKDLPQISNDTRTNLRDILDHVSRSIDHLESYRELLNGLMDSHMSRISNRMNQVMEMLSIIATIMLPLSFLTGVFGMNFHYIPGLDSDWGFWVLVAFMLLMVSGMIAVFKKKGFI
jgi:magnesium transporter